MEKIGMKSNRADIQVGTHSRTQQYEILPPNQRAVDGPPEAIRHLVRLGFQAFPRLIDEGIDGVRRCAIQATSNMRNLEQWSLRTGVESDWGIYCDADSDPFILEVHGITGVAALRSRYSGLCDPQETLKAGLRSRVFMFFKYPENKRIRTGLVAPGLRVLYPDDFILLPFSLLQEGPSVLFLDPDASVAPAPGWLLQEAV